MSRLPTFVAGLVAFSQCFWPSLTLAQDHAHAAASSGRSALVQVVREWTAQYKDVAAAELAEYHLMFGCVSGSEAKHPGTTPQLMGQLFHYFDAPNRFSLPAFYTLHVWAWKENPSGTFVNWHDNVSCNSFNPQQ